MRHTFIFLLFAVAATACNRPQPPDTRTMLRKSLHGVLVYPASTLVDVASGSDAAQVTLTTLDSASLVAGWFREALTLNGWTLESDVKSPDGSIAISASKGARPLWVTFKPNVGGPGSTYVVTGAVVSGDSVSVPDSGSRKPPAQRPRPAAQ